MKFVSATLFLSLISCASALEEPSSKLESMRSERHLQKLKELDEGFAKLQLDTGRDLQLGSGLFCEEQLDVCLNYTEGASIELFPTYLAPMQNGTVPVRPLVRVATFFLDLGLVLGEALGLTTLFNVLSVIDTVLDVISNLLSRFRTMAFETIVTEMIELERQTSEVFEESEAAWDQFAQMQEEVLAIVQNSLNSASARGGAVVANAYNVVASFLTFYADLYRSIIAVGLGANSDSIIDCQTARLSCAINHLAIDVVPTLTSLVMLTGSDATTVAPVATNATAAPAATANATDAPVTTNATSAPIASNTTVSP